MIESNGQASPEVKANGVELYPSRNMNQNASGVRLPRGSQRRSETSSKSSAYLDPIEYGSRVMNKQIGARMRLKGRLAIAESLNQAKNSQAKNEIDERELTSWECWASSKADYIKNKKRMEKPIVPF